MIVTFSFESTHRSPISADPDSVICCQPVFLFPELKRPQGYSYYACAPHELPKIEPESLHDNPTTRPTEIPVMCAWCGILIRWEQGSLQAGVSHGICKQCLAEQFQNQGL